MLVAATMRSYLLTARGIFLGLEQFGRDALVTSADRLLLLLACGTALLRGAGVVEVCVVFLAVRAVTAGGALWLARQHVGDGAGTFDRALWRSLPAQALPLGAFLLVLNLYNYVDTLILGVMTSDTETGLYNAAYPLYEGLTYGTAILSSVLTPRFARLWSVDRPAHRRLAVTSVLGAAGVAVLALAIAWPLGGLGLRVVFDTSYLPALPALRILLLGLPFVYVTWVLHALAMSAFRARLLLGVTAAGTVLNVALNLVLIPRASYDGAAVATVLSECVVVGLLLYGLRDILGRAAPASPVSRSR
jgi:O-antigen/teichoic acid export membrane protein